MIRHRLLPPLAGLLLGWPVAGCASRGPLMLGPARPPTEPDRVRIYAERPPRAEDIALLRASATGRERNDELVAHFREEAAQVGANGVVLDGFVDDNQWRTRPHGFLSTGVSNRGSGTGVGLGLDIQPPRSWAEGRAVWVP